MVGDFFPFRLSIRDVMLVVMYAAPAFPVLNLLVVTNPELEFLCSSRNSLQYHHLEHPQKQGNKASSSAVVHLFSHPNLAMKSTLLLLACAFTGSVVAQNREDYFPECSLKCLDQATKQATDCSLDDAVCMCVQKNYEAIYNAGLNCVLQACGPDEAVGMFSSCLTTLYPGPTHTVV